MMICSHCGTQAENGARICPVCGGTLSPYSGKDGAMTIRQGRMRAMPPAYMPSAESGQYRQDAGRPGDRRKLETETIRAPQRRRSEGAKLHGMQRRGVNHALLIAILAVVAVLMAIGLLVLAFRLPQGHLLLLRATREKPERQEQVIGLIGEEAAAEALWQIGHEELDEGMVTRAITTYLQAYTLYPQINGLYDHLLSLADAYEAIGNLNDAEQVYRQLFEQVDPSNPLAYRYLIDLMLDQNRLFEATDLMRVAYEKTNELSFKSQREQRVPLAPVSDPSTGRYMLERSVALSSPQDYDVYYLLDDAEGELPENGILYTTPIPLGEGTHEIRAVCVSSELLSDEVTLRYTIWYPTPSAPRSRVLTGVYDKPIRVRFYMPNEDADTPDQELTIYYTIDGTTPNSDSPIYDLKADEGFRLTLGKYTVRAVAVNQYGKISNEYVGTYTISGRVTPTYFRDTDDQFKAFTLGKSTYEDFKRLYGPGREEYIDTPETYSGKTLRVVYDWGEARFSDVGKTLYAVSTNYASMTGPRNTKVGMKPDEVIAAFRDIGQVANAKGDRSLYYDVAVGYGRYYQESETSARLEYVYWREDDATTTLLYTFTNGVVSRIRMSIRGLMME